MFPDLTFLIALVLGLGALAPAASAPPLGPWGTLLVLGVVGGLSRLAVQRGREALEQGELEAAYASVRWVGLWPLLGWVTCLSVFGWGTWVATVVPRIVWMLPMVVLLLPLVVAFGFAWTAQGEIEAALAKARGLLPRTASAGEAFRGGLKRNALAFLPLFVLLGLFEALYVAGELGVEPARAAGLWLEHFPLLQLALFGVLLVLALPLLPVLVGRLTQAAPLPAGPLRARLERAAAALQLPVKGLYLWNTQGRVLNAMVVGFGRSRRIFLTDRLAAELPEDEIEAVFLHEAGHAVRRHIPLYLVLFLTLALWIEAVQRPLIAMGISPFFILLLNLALFWFVLLGVISRRFEREADLFAVDFAERVPQPLVQLPGLLEPLPAPAFHLLRAFERLNRATGGRSPAHRHGTLEDRARIVAAYAGNESVRRGERRVSQRLRLGILVAALGAVALTVLQLPTQWAEARAGVLGADADRLERGALDLELAGEAKAARAAFANALAAWQDVARAHPGEAGRRQAHVAVAGIALDHLDDLATARAALEAAGTQTAGTQGAGRDTAADDLEGRWTAFLRETLAARLAAREGDLAGAERSLARAARRHDVLRGAEELAAEARRYADELMRLSRAVVDAAAPDDDAGALPRQLARQRLADIAGGSSPEAHWRELRGIAKKALARLDATAATPAADAD
ncbi:MAG: M48 family metalloprotease [Planctomycetota bacterium]